MILTQYKDLIINFFQCSNDTIDFWSYLHCKETRNTSWVLVKLTKKVVKSSKKLVQTDFESI